MVDGKSVDEVPIEITDSTKNVKIEMEVPITVLDSPGKKGVVETI